MVSGRVDFEGVVDRRRVVLFPKAVVQTRRRATHASMATGWLIGVMVEVAGEPVAVRHFFAVGLNDQAKAEWLSIDQAQKTGPVAVSPVAGLEPVHAVAEITPAKVGMLGLKPGEVRLLGTRWPRRWMPVESPAAED